MVYPRQVLNRLRWTEGESLSDATIWYAHRGVAGGVTSLSGADIVSLDRSFIQVERASIPYHRITKIEYRGEIIFDKEAERQQRGKETGDIDE